MSALEITDDELLAYLQEELPAEELVRIESIVRNDSTVRQRLEYLVSTRDVGARNVGAVWRRHRLSCPSRETLGSYLLNVLSPDEARFIELHLAETRCVFCESNLTDLKRAGETQPNDARPSRDRYFQSSVGRLPK